MELYFRIFFFQEFVSSGVCLVRSLSRQEFVFQEFLFSGVCLSGVCLSGVCHGAACICTGSRITLNLVFQLVSVLGVGLL